MKEEHKRVREAGADGRSNRRRLAASRRQEARIARVAGARVTPASGALWGSKGDVRSRFAMVEAKRTSKRQIVLKQEWVETLRSQSALAGVIPYLGIEIGGRNYLLICEEDL